MDKEGIRLLQELDCNCNDCKFFQRDNAALNASKQLHRDMDAASYRSRRRYFWNEAKMALEKGNKARHDGLLKERSRITIDTAYRTGLVFGNCAKFTKPVATVPNVCQPDTQHCFAHRRS